MSLTKGENMEKTVEYMIAHIRTLKSNGFHSMADEVLYAMERMAGGQSSAYQQYYKGWTAQDFQRVLNAFK